MLNLLDLNLDEFKEWMKENNEKAYRANQVFDWIYKNVWNFRDMRNIPQSLVAKLDDCFYIGIPDIVETYKSIRDDTEKFLLRYADNNIIECVVMKYKHGNSICVSTQVGCRMGCKFCASTLGGVIRNLTSGEILAQVLTAQMATGERISNIVLMGSGEPLDNFENVTKFISLVNSEWGINIGQRHITLSTCGIVPNIIKLADRNYQITLAISLHAPNDVIRKSMMPIAYKYSIKEILQACSYYIEKTNRRITYEYALVSNVNDSEEQARELAKLLRGTLCHVNLIPVNEVRENTFKKSSSDRIEIFYNTLKNNGIETTIRKEMGSDINAACGQLRRSYLESENDSKGV